MFKVCHDILGSYCHVISITVGEVNDELSLVPPMTIKAGSKEPPLMFATKLEAIMVANLLEKDLEIMARQDAYASGDVNNWRDHMSSYGVWYVVDEEGQTVNQL